MTKILVTFVTSSEFKRVENEALVAECHLGDGLAVSDVFKFEIRSVSMPEPLESDLEQLVRAEAAAAYARSSTSRPRRS